MLLHIPQPTFTFLPLTSSKIKSTLINTAIRPWITKNTPNITNVIKKIFDIFDDEFVYVVTDEEEINSVEKDNLIYEINSIFKKLQKRLYIKALEYLLDNQKDLSKNSTNFESVRVNKTMWCGDESCLRDNVSNLNIISFNQQRSDEYCYFCQKKAKHQVSIIKKI